MLAMYNEVYTLGFPGVTIHRNRSLVTLYFSIKTRRNDLVMYGQHREKGTILIFA